MLMIDQYFGIVGDDWQYEDDFGLEQTYIEGAIMQDKQLSPHQGYGFSFMETDDEGEFYDQSETGGYAVDLEDFRIDDESEFYDPVEHQANVVGELSFTDRLMRTLGSISASFPKGGKSVVPGRGRASPLQGKYGMSGVGAGAPGRVPLSGAKATDTDMLRLSNFMKSQAADARLRTNLENLPLPRPGPTPQYTGVNIAKVGGIKGKTTAGQQRQAAILRG